MDMSLSKPRRWQTSWSLMLRSMDHKESGYNWGLKDNNKIHSCSKKFHIARVLFLPQSVWHNRIMLLMRTDFAWKRRASERLFSAQNSFCVSCSRWALALSLCTLFSPPAKIVFWMSFHSRLYFVFFPLLHCLRIRSPVCPFSFF